MFWSVQSNRHLQSLPGKINPTFKFKKLIYISRETRYLAFLCFYVMLAFLWGMF